MSHAGWRSNGKVEMDRRQFLAAAGIAGVSAAVVGLPRAEAQPAADVSGELVACVAGGAWETAFREHMAKPFSQKYPKVKLHLDLSAGTVQLAKLRAARGSNPPFDVVQMLDEQMDIAVREGLIDPFDAAEVPNIKTFYAISTPAKWQKDGRYFAAHQNWGQLGITYRTDKVKNPPKEWLDFWKPEYKGLVGMPPVSYSVGLQFFIATVHALGGDEKNPADVDRGFEKMKELKASIAQQPADAGAIQQLLERGDIAVVPLWDGRAFGLAAAGLPIGFSYPTKPGPVASGAGNGIAKGTKNRAAALKLLDFRFSPEAQKGFCQQMWYGPSNSTVKLDPKYAAKVAYGTEHYSKLLAPNYDVVGQKLGDWTQRWTAIFTS
jgi:putative spermidine/putrescine transport system substrate-binding protein